MHACLSLSGIGIGISQCPTFPGQRSPNAGREEEALAEHRALFRNGSVRLTTNDGSRGEAPSSALIVRLGDARQEVSYSTPSLTKRRSCKPSASESQGGLHWLTLQ
jgi:hypothetical protein